jgi:hypothetical protein
MVTYAHGENRGHYVLFLKEDRKEKNPPLSESFLYGYTLFRETFFRFFLHRFYGV